MTTRAAVLPFYKGHCALILPGAPPLVREVGRLVCRVHGAAKVDGCDVCAGTMRPGALRREVDAETAAALVNELAGAIRGAGVGSVVVEAPGRGGGVAAEHMAAVGQALAAALMVPWVPVTWVVPTGARPTDVVERARALLGDAPSRDLKTGGGDDVRDRSDVQQADQANEVLLLGSAQAGPAVQGSRDLGVVGDAGRCDPVPGREHSADAQGSVRPGGDDRAAAGGRRVAGIDPGYRHISITILDVTADGLRHVDTHAIDIGHTEGGRAVVSDEEIERLLLDVVTHLSRWRVGVATVERAMFYMGGDVAPGVMAAQAAGLMRSANIGGELAGVLRVATMLDGEAHVPVVGRVRRISSARWRNHACRLAGVTDWREAVYALVPGLGAVGEHGVDSAGAAVWSATGPEEGAGRGEAKPKAEAPRGRTKSGEDKARKAARDKARRERLREARVNVEPKPRAARTCGKCGGTLAGHVRGLPCPALPAPSSVPVTEKV